MDAAKIGDFLSALRKAQGYTQQEVAEKLNLSNKTISKWENGGGLPDITVLPALAELYGVTVDEILVGQRLGREPSGAARTRCREAGLYLLRRGNLAMNICCLPAAAFAVWEVVISFYQFVSLLLYDDRGYNRSYLLLPLELLAMLIVAVGLLLQRHRFTTAKTMGAEDIWQAEWRRSAQKALFLLTVVALPVSEYLWELTGRKGIILVCIGLLAVMWAAALWKKPDLLCGRAKILLILAEAALGLSCAAALVFGYEFRAIYWLRFLLYTALLLASAATQAYAERRQKVN